jgi:6-phosphogluconolactonase
MTELRVPSRRDFLAATASGFFTLATGRLDAVTGRRLPDEELLYVGTYTDGDAAEGIHLVRFDATSGGLRLAASVDGGANPSFLSMHPNGRWLYAVNEVTDYGGRPAGAVSAFAVDAGTGALSRINEVSSEGGAPCYVSVDRGGRALLVANYVGGNVVLFPTHSSGAVLPATRIVQHVGTGPDKERQEAAHAHFIAPDPSNRFALAVDLGVDRVLVYRLDVDNETMHHVEGAHADMRPGAGPRHLAFHPTLPLVYVANELDSTVATLRFDAATGRLAPIASQSTLPAGWRGDNYPADIHVSRSGRTLYVSNRGHNSIAVFSISGENLARVQHISTEGDWPRNFALDPTGKWLLVANQRSGSVVVFARDDASGRLTPTRQRLELARPVCLLFPSLSS